MFLTNFLWHKMMPPTQFDNMENGMSSLEKKKMETNLSVAETNDFVGLEFSSNED